MKNHLKEFDGNSLMLSIIITLIIPYFQNFNFSDSQESAHLGFPFKFITVRETLSGTNFLNSFGVDVFSLILSILSFYFVIKVIKYFFLKN